MREHCGCIKCNGTRCFRTCVIFFRAPFERSEEGDDREKVAFELEGTPDMRFVTAHLLPLLAAATASGLLLSVAIV